MRLRSKNGRLMRMTPRSRDEREGEFPTGTLSKVPRLIVSSEYAVAYLFLQERDPSVRENGRRSACKKCGCSAIAQRLKSARSCKTIRRA